MLHTKRKKKNQKLLAWSAIGWIQKSHSLRKEAALEAGGTAADLLPDGSRVNRLWLGWLISLMLGRVVPVMLWVVLITPCRALLSWVEHIPWQSCFQSGCFLLLLCKSNLSVTISTLPCFHSCNEFHTAFHPFQIIPTKMRGKIIRFFRFIHTSIEQRLSHPLWLSHVGHMPAAAAKYSPQALSIFTVLHEYRTTCCLQILSFSKDFSKMNKLKQTISSILLYIWMLYRNSAATQLLLLLPFCLFVACICTKLQ